MKKLRLKNNHMNKKLPCGAAFLLGKKILRFTGLWLEGLQA
jgi:hypothetical protein